MLACTEATFRTHRGIGTAAGGTERSRSDRARSAYRTADHLTCRLCRPESVCFIRAMVAVAVGRLQTPSAPRAGGASHFLSKHRRGGATKQACGEELLQSRHGILRWVSENPKTSGRTCRSRLTAT